MTITANESALKVAPKLDSLNGVNVRDKTQENSLISKEKARNEVKPEASNNPPNNSPAMMANSIGKNVDVTA